MKPAAVPLPDLRPALVSAIARLGKPVSAKELRAKLTGPYKRDLEELARVLEDLAVARQVFVVAGRTRRYAHRDPEEIVGQSVIEALRGGPLTKTEITRRVKKAAPGLDGALPGVLKALVSQGAVREHPKANSKQPLRYGLDPPDPTPFLGKAVKEVQAALRKLAPHGVPLSSLYAALGRALGIERAPAPDPAHGDADDESAVLDALGDLSAREPPGALLSIRALRALRPMAKDRFDRAVLRLADAGRVVLHHHDYPMSLSPAERAELVQDPRGIHYIGIAPRRGP
jgi:hypothetical protein